MSAALIAQLIATFGPGAIQLVDALIVKIEQNGTVSSTEWQAMTANARVTAAQQMANRLTAAGIDPNSPQGQMMVKLAS